MARVTTADKIEAAGGIDWVCEQIEDDIFYKDIARKLGVPKSKLIEWVHADKDRSAQARKSMKAAAYECDRKAEEILKDIPNGNDPGAIARARELASHYRWRAKVRCPDTYGDRQKVDTQGSVTIKFDNLDKNA